MANIDDADRSGVVGGAVAMGGLLHFDRDLDRQQAEQGRELDDRVEGHRRGVLERIAHGVAHDGRGVQRRALFPKSTSTYFLALSHAPPELAIEMAWNKPKTAIEIR